MEIKVADFGDGKPRGKPTSETAAVWYGPVSSNSVLSFVSAYSIKEEGRGSNCEYRVLNANTGVISRLASVGYIPKGDSFELALLQPDEPTDALEASPAKLYSANVFWQLTDGSALCETDESYYGGVNTSLPGFPIVDFDSLAVDYFPYPKGMKTDIIRLFDYNSGIVIYSKRPLTKQEDEMENKPEYPNELWRFDRKSNRWTNLGELESRLPLFVSDDGSKLCAYDMSGVYSGKPIQVGMLDLSDRNLKFTRLDGLPDIDGVTQGVIRLPN